MNARRGSAWVDVAVVVGIVAMLVGITMPMMTHAKQRAHQIRCAGRLREVGQAMNRYADDHRGMLPATRPSRGPIVKPDITNSGADARDPFAADGPAENNVPAVMFLLVREKLVSSQDMICPGAAGRADGFAGKDARQRSNFTNVRDNLSYGVQNPYADDVALQAGFGWRVKLNPDAVLAADRGVACAELAQAVPTSPWDVMVRINSRNHSSEGQNVLYADGRVEFRATPFAGIDGDNIYVNARGRVLDSPVGPTDTVLLPLEECGDRP